jgi:hypothetical protein
MALGSSPIHAEGLSALNPGKIKCPNAHRFAVGRLDSAQERNGRAVLSSRELAAQHGASRHGCG